MGSFEPKCVADLDVVGFEFDIAHLHVLLLAYQSRAGTSLTFHQEEL